jgi:hypothetical protein
VRKCDRMREEKGENDEKVATEDAEEYNSHENDI